MNDYEFGNRLYALRKKCKMSQAELGNLVNVSDKAVSKWETGKSKPGIDIMNKLSLIFNVKIEDLMEENKSDVGARSDRKV